MAGLNVVGRLSDEGVRAGLDKIADDTTKTQAQVLAGQQDFLAQQVQLAETGSNEQAKLQHDLDEKTAEASRAASAEAILRVTQEKISAIEAAERAARHRGSRQRSELQSALVHKAR